MTVNRYLLVFVGCLECGGDTYAQGAYPSEAAARDAIPDDYTDREVHGPFGIGDRSTYEWHGHGVVVIFDLENT